MPQSRVIKSPEIGDPAITVGMPEGGAEGRDPGSGAEGPGRGSGGEDDEFLYGYGEDEEGEPPDPLAEERAELERQAEEARERAREEGHREGVAAAEAETADKLQAAEALLRDLGGLVDGAEVDYLESLEELKEQAVTLCLAVAEKLALRTLHDEDGALAGIIAEAIDRAATDTRLTLRLHPEDETLLGDGWQTLLAGRNGGIEVDLVADEAVSRGGCVIEAGGGRVDATVESRLDAVRLAVRPVAPDEAADAATD
jgi:flagellar assembly protein FliH